MSFPLYVMKEIVDIFSLYLFTTISKLNFLRHWIISSF